MDKSLLRPLRQAAWSVTTGGVPSPRDDRPTRAVVLLFGLGGVPALIDQVAWQRILALHSGVGAVSVTVIVSAYMAGLGVGSLLGGALSKRIGPRAALLAFALVELALGVFAWSSGPLYYELPGFDRAWFRGTTWQVAAAHFLALIPPTTLMGMTFPLLTRALVRDANRAAGLVGVLYGANLVGAALGALLTPWLLIPRLGITGALRFGAACNVLGAVGVLLAGRGLAPESPAVGVAQAEGDRRRASLGTWAVLYFLGGFLAIGLEIVWFRIIDVGVKSTTFTFGTVLAVYLVGLAAGTLLGARGIGRNRDPMAEYLACQCGILLYTGLGLILLVNLPPGFWGLSWYVEYWGSYEPIAPGWGAWLATLALYGVFPIVLFGPPTVLMGLSFAALQRGVQDEARTSGFKVGILQAANIAGCVLGGLLVGLRGLASPGTAAVLAGMVGFGAVLAAVAGVRAWSRGKGAAVWAWAGGAVALAAVAVLSPRGDALWQRLHGQRDRRAFVAEDVASVSALIPEWGADRWRMSVNGKGQSLLPFGGIHSKLGALPATLHPGPERVAIIGLGSGDTAWAAACRRETQRVTVFETCANQYPLLHSLDGRPGLSNLSALLHDARIGVVEADGRDAIAAGERVYDLIEADAIRPNGAYSGNLYSVEFFRLCAAKLRPGGLMCTWSPTPRTRAGFLRAFPHVLELDRGVMLIGSNEPIPADLAAWRARLRSEHVASYLGPGVLPECLGSLDTARPLAPGRESEGEVNTDLFPRDEYQSPPGRP